MCNKQFLRGYRLIAFALWAEYQEGKQIYSQLAKKYGCSIRTIQRKIAIELKELVSLLKKTDKESFKGSLDDWFDKWVNYLNERTINPDTGKSHYTHKRLRSAYRSLKNNLLGMI